MMIKSAVDIVVETKVTSGKWWHLVELITLREVTYTLWSEWEVHVHAVFFAKRRVLLQLVVCGSCGTSEVFINICVV